MDLYNNIVLVIVVILGAPLVGALLQGLDRIITARIQGRIGPPLFQPLYDIVKLLRKEPIVLNRPQIVYAFLHLAFMVATLLMLILGQDSLMILFIFALSTLSLVIGGMSVRSPYSRIGSQREIVLMVGYEPILVLMVVGFYHVNGNFNISAILAANRPLLLSLPLVFLSFLVVLAIKLQKSPFDLATSHHAHQELVKGLTIEFAGPYLALIEIAHCYEVAILFTLLTLFWATNLAIGAGIAAACFLLMILVDNAFARLTTLRVFRFMWTTVLGLALTNIIWLYLR